MEAVHAALGTRAAQVVDDVLVPAGVLLDVNLTG